MAAGLYLPQSAREWRAYEEAGIQDADGTVPDAGHAKALQKRLRAIDPNLHVGFDTRGNHPERWCVYYSGGPEGNMEKVFPIQHEDGTYMQPREEIVNNVRDTHADPAHYEKLMTDEYNRQKREKRHAAEEWADAGQEAADFIAERYIDGYRPSTAISKGIEKEVAE